MITQSRTYTNLSGQTISLADLDEQEHELLQRIRRRADENPEWNEFDAFWWREVARFYDARGLSRQSSMRTPVYKIAQDLSSRLAIEAGLAREPDYRDELADLIRRRFKSRREFCDATGISPDMLSHVLARRKHLSIEALEQALARIGCSLRIAPRETANDPCALSRPGGIE